MPDERLYLINKDCKDSYNNAEGKVMKGVEQFTGSQTYAYCESCESFWIEASRAFMNNCHAVELGRYQG